MAMTGDAEGMYYFSIHILQSTSSDIVAPHVPIKK